MKNNRLMHYLTTKFRNLLRRQDGSIAVEGAVVISALSFLFIGLADVGVAAYRTSQMETSLRVAAQYIVNDGEDPQMVEEFFRNSYGDASASFVAKLVCRCARERMLADDGSFDPAAVPPEPTDEEIAVLRVNGAWNQCSITCADQPLLKFTDFRTDATVTSFFRGAGTEISSRMFVRVE